MTPLHNRKSAAGNPPPTVRAPVLDPTCEGPRGQFPRSTHLLILQRDQAVIHQCQQLVTEWLQKLGRELHPTKTRLAHTRDPEGGKAGFAFLGFEIRPYPVRRHNAKGGGKTLSNPSRDAITRP